MGQGIKSGRAVNEACVTGVRGARALHSKSDYFPWLLFGAVKAVNSVDTSALVLE